MTAIAFEFPLIVDLNILDNDLMIVFLSFNAKIEFAQNAERFRATAFDFECAENVENDDIYCLFVTNFQIIC